MIREKKTYPFIKKYKSRFFWRDCRFCRREFKKELGFIIEDYIPYTSYISYTYCCPECALTVEDVRNKLKILNNSSLNSRNSPCYFPNSHMDCDD